MEDRKSGYGSWSRSSYADMFAFRQAAYARYPRERLNWSNWNTNTILFCQIVCKI